MTIRGNRYINFLLRCVFSLNNWSTHQMINLNSIRYFMTFMTLDRAWCTKPKIWRKFHFLVWNYVLRLEKNLFREFNFTKFFKKIQKWLLKRDCTHHTHIEKISSNQFFSKTFFHKILSKKVSESTSAISTLHCECASSIFQWNQILLIIYLV